jgi:hypothetical protein
MGRQQIADDDPNAANAKDGSWSDFLTEQLYEVHVTDVREGRSNQMWQGIKTLALQTAFKYPLVDFEDLTPEEAAINQQYLKIITGRPPRGCNAVDAGRLALLDSLIGGAGATRLIFNDGRPAVDWCDVLDLTWDTGAKLIPNIKWVSIKVRRSLYEWIEEYGEKHFADDLNATDKEDVLDKRIELEFYYDTDGEKGHHCVLRREGVVDVTVIDKGDNPFYASDDGFPQPYLPINFIYFMQLPSVKFPVGLCEFMLPHQISIWQQELNFSNTTKRGNQHFSVEKGSMEEADYQAFLNNKTQGVIQRKAGMAPPVVIPGMEISEADRLWYQQNVQQLVAQSGANPYAGGDRVQGVEFSSEVSAIQSAASLTAGVVSKDMAAHWERTMLMLLQAGAVYDTSPIKIRIGETTLEFDEEEPIKMFLRPDGDLVVRENSFAYTPAAQRVSEAANTITVAQTALAVGGPRFMPFFERALEEFLRAKGEKDIGAWMEAPEMNPMGIDQDAQTQAATQ